MSIISTSQTVHGQPSSRFHVEAWLPSRNCETVYWSVQKGFKTSYFEGDLSLVMSFIIILCVIMFLFLCDLVKPPFKSLARHYLLQSK